MFFDEKFISQLQEKPIEGVIEICQKVWATLSEETEWYERDYEILLEAYALLHSLKEAELIDQLSFPEIEGSRDADCRIISVFLRNIEELYSSQATKLKLESLKTHFKANLGNGFCYEFSQGDLDRIQTLINELRQHVSNSTDFAPDHKQRLLARLEKLQTEMHKKVSDLDRFWGLIGDAGVALGKFGDDAKPIVERIKEIKDIVWRTQARAEELPSDCALPQLENKSDSSEFSTDD